MNLRELSDAIDNLLDVNMDAPVFGLYDDEAAEGPITAVRYNVVTKRIEVIIS